MLKFIIITVIMLQVVGCSTSKKKSNIPSKVTTEARDRN